MVFTFFLLKGLLLVTRLLGRRPRLFRFSNLVVGFPPASVKDECDLSESRTIVRNIFSLSGLRTGNHTSHDREN